MTTALTTQHPQSITRGNGFDSIVSLVLDGLTSEHSRRAYDRALTDFLTWWASQGKSLMSKAIVRRYKRKLQDDGLVPSTINLKLSAIRKLAQEAADNGLVDPNLAAGIARVKSVTSGGRRSGNWLTREQAQELLNAPNKDPQGPERPGYTRRAVGRGPETFRGRQVDVCTRPAAGRPVGDN